MSLFEWDYINYNENENEKRSHRYGINRLRPRDRHEYTKYENMSECNYTYVN